MALRSLGGLAIQSIKAIGAFATRALTADIPDSTATGGNARGTNAVDLQTTRGLASQVASGIGAFVVGSNNTASGNQASAFGNSVVASGATSFATGLSTTAAGTRGQAHGNLSNDRGRWATIVHAGGQRAASGDAQSLLSALLRGTTTDAATGVRLTADGAAAGAANVLNLANTTALRFRILLVAMVANTSAKEWTIEGLIRQGASAATAAFPTAATITSVYGDAGLATAAVACTADTTNGGINLTVNGVAATTIQWVAFVQGVEVG